MNRTILMLEDDEDDRYITQSVFDEKQFNVTIDFVSTSREIMTHLQSCSKGGSEFPSIILLNYHSFPINSLGILKDIKSNPACRHIPVVVLSGSVHPDIVKQCYDEGASSYIQKPSSNDETNKKIEIFVRYWFETVELA